jgi:CRP-like cAMP-binding protein
LNTVDLGPLRNKLLAAIPHGDFEQLRPHLTVQPMERGAVICEAGLEVDRVYFPISGMISLLVVMRDGKAIETATVGREGVFGAMSGLGLHISRVRAIVQLPMVVCHMASAQLRKIAVSSKPVTDLCIGYNEALLDQARITAACNALHTVEARFCRWLLQTRDRADSDDIALTQEFLSEMLGVRRTSVTEVAQKVQARGAITYVRGMIKVVDLEKLKAMSCECYEAVRGHNQ